MGTGVELMLIGAAVGAGMGAGASALTGGDPLKGALIGGLTGGVTGGLGGFAAAPAAAAPAVAAPAAASLGGAAGGASLGAAGNAALGSMLTPASLGLSAAEGAGAASLGGAAGGASLGAAGNAALGSMFTPASLGLASAEGAGTQLAQQGATAATRGVLEDYAPKFLVDYAKNHPFLTTGLGAMGLSGVSDALLGTSDKSGAEFNPSDFPSGDPRKKYRGPLSNYVFNPAGYMRSSAPGYAGGGIADLPPRITFDPRSRLGRYSDGGRLTRGPGDGMSDSIPAQIGRRQPARLADGEFVVPADVVSHLGNGSTDAGARNLYSMMDKVRQARTGNKQQGREINPRKYIPT